MSQGKSARAPVSRSHWAHESAFTYATAKRSDGPSVRGGDGEAPGADSDSVSAPFSFSYLISLSSSLDRCERSGARKWCNSANPVLRPRAAL